MDSERNSFYENHRNFWAGAGVGQDRSVDGIWSDVKVIISSSLPNVLCVHRFRKVELILFLFFFSRRVLHLSKQTDHPGTQGG